MYRTLLFLIPLFAFWSCQSISGSGNIVSETRNVGTFDEIQASGSIDIDVSNDNSQSVRVEADDNVLPYIITEVKGNSLEAHFKSNIFLHNVHAKVLVAAHDIRKFSIAGSGNIVSKETLTNPDKIQFSVAGSGDIKVMLDAPNVVADIAGSGTISLSGKTKNLKCDISGSGDLKCRNLMSENTDVTISGSGSAHVFASVSLHAVVNGSGDVYYSGNAPSRQFSGHGSFHEEK